MHEYFVMQGQWLRRVYRGDRAYHAGLANLAQPQTLGIRDNSARKRCSFSIGNALVSRRVAHETRDDTYRLLASTAMASVTNVPMPTPLLVTSSVPPN